MLMLMTGRYRPGALIAGTWAAMQYMGERYVMLWQLRLPRFSFTNLCFPGCFLSIFVVRFFVVGLCAGRLVLLRFGSVLGLGSCRLVSVPLACGSVRHNGITCVGVFGLYPDMASFAGRYDNVPSSTPTILFAPKLTWHLFSISFLHS